MKRVLFFILVFSVASAQAQFSDDYRGRFKLGTGYARDFPGVAGIGITGEFSFAMSDNFEGAVGLKRLSMQGYPRTSSVEEYTRATTVDFNIYYLPLHTETSIIRLGAGYALSSYKLRRSYPVSTGTGIDKQTSWPVQDTKGRTGGMSLIAEYEYMFANSNFSLGARAAWYKAYDRATYIGPFAAVRF